MLGKNKNNKWKNSTQAATQTQQQPQQVATRQASVPLTNVNNLGFPDDAYINVGESIDLLQAFFADFGLDRQLNPDEIENHLALVEDHEQRIDSLEKRVEALEKSSSQAQVVTPQQAQAAQQAAAQATPQAQAATPQAQVATQTQQQAVTPQAQTCQFGDVRVEHMYRSGSFVCYDPDDAKQTASCADDPKKVRCFVNNLRQAAELTPEQMVVLGYANVLATIN